MMSLTLISDFEWLLHNWRQQFSDLHSKLEERAASGESQEAIQDLKNFHLSQIQAFKKARVKAAQSFSEAQLTRYDSMVLVVCALCDDEVLSKDDWPKDADDQLIIESRAWLDSLMEQAIFGTRNVGWSLPRAMQDLAARTHCDAIDLDLAEIYLHAISLGFGSATSEISGEMLRLRHGLSELINRESSDRLKVDLNLVGEQPPADREPGRLAPFHKWRRYVSTAAVVFVAITTVLYVALTVWLRASLQL